MVVSLAALWALFVFQVPVAPCQTQTGVPCFTLTYEHSVWALVQSPVRDLVTAEVTGTMAVRADGSFLHRTQPTSRFAVRGSRDPAPPNTRLYLATGQQLIVHGPPSDISDFRLPALFFLGGVHRRSLSSADSCRSVLTGLGQNFELTGKSNLLSEPVVNWKFKTPYGEAVVSVAPALDCQVLRMEASEYRYRHLPIRKELFEAKTLHRGEPAAALFVPPKGK